jgi:hypothetical protein
MDIVLVTYRCGVLVEARDDRRFDIDNRNLALLFLWFHVDADIFKFLACPLGLIGDYP